MLEAKGLGKHILGSWSHRPVPSLAQEGQEPSLHTLPLSSVQTGSNLNKPVCFQVIHFGLLLLNPL